MICRAINAFTGATTAKCADLTDVRSKLIVTLVARVANIQCMIACVVARSI